MASQIQLIKKAQNVVDKKDKPSRARCPIHGASGTETVWKPPKGIDPNMREFSCGCEGLYEGHAFYVSCPPAEPKPQKTQNPMLRHQIEQQQGALTKDKLL